MPICVPGEPARWTHVQSLMAAAIAAGDSLGVSVEDPTQDSSSVFSQPDPIPVTLAMTFELDPGKIVSAAYLSGGLGSTAAWDFPVDFLQTLEDASDLFFIADEDSCWCKTMWRVIPCSQGHTLEQVGAGEKSTGCCPSLPVLAVGEALDFNQNWIPAGPTLYHTSNEAPSEDETTRDSIIPKCVNSGGGCLLRKTRVEGATRITHAQRELVGTLTWRIKPEHFQEIWDKLQEICDNSCGAKGERVRKARVKLDNEPGMFLCSMAQVKMRDILFSMREGEVAIPELEDPGCVELVGCDIRLPWLTATCGGIVCEGSTALRLYCTTLIILEKVIQQLPSFLNPVGYVNSCGLTCSDARTNNLVQCENDFVNGISDYFSSPEDWENLPPWVVVLHEKFKVEGCSGAICSNEDGTGVDYWRRTAAYYKVYGVYLEDMVRAAYDAWKDQATTRLSCHAYWSVEVHGPYNTGAGSGGSTDLRSYGYLTEQTQLGYATSLFLSQEPVVGYTDSNQCHPATTRVEARLPVMGLVNACNSDLDIGKSGQLLDGSTLGVKGTNGYVYMGYQLLSADIEVIEPIDDASCYAQTGFATTGTDVPFEWGTGSIVNFGYELFYSSLFLQCLCPYAFENLDPDQLYYWFYVQSGGAYYFEPTSELELACNAMLFEHECD